MKKERIGEIDIKRKLKYNYIFIFIKITKRKQLVKYFLLMQINILLKT